MAHLRTSIKFDMRAPAFGAPPRELYAAALDMAAFADEIGIGSINAMEHHGFEDSYLPTPFVFGGGVAARTRQCRISLGAVVLPLHDPVKVAEQIAVLDLMSGGRLDVIIGAGYVASEFAMFRADMKDRAKALDEGLEIILRALSGERFTHSGREIFVRPLPVQKPEDILIVGGGIKESARRAARFGLGFGPMKRGLFTLYDEECRKHGRDPGRKSGPGGMGDVHLTRDPEAAWAHIMPHLKHAVGDYARLAEESGVNSPFRGLLANEDALRQCGIVTVCSPEELLVKAANIDELGSVTFMPLMGGLAPALGWESLRLLAEVMPELAKIVPQPERDA